MTVQTADQSKQIVEKALSGLGEIATLPEVTVKIIEIVEDARSTARDLHEVIKHDPALSAKVLKVVNSAFYGLPGQIASVDRAIILLGLSAVKNIAIATSIARLFKGGRISEGFTATDLWRHSLAVGVACRLLAKKTHYPVQPDELFVAGLIHDMGILVERQAFPEKLTEVITAYSKQGGDFLELENAIIGANHQQFGGGLTTRWKFPRHLRAACGFHHNPDALSAELQKLGNVVKIADVLCCQEKLGFFYTHENGQITDAMLEDIGISREQLDETRAELPDQLADAEGTLTV
ncbi:MAG: HDOD domain-containing protein [Phycisphaerae bacterium]|nr:MAG: HDOD domain-containing protein [Planctomycetota bacterium]KAB2947414.1 MAG: HDOD domain-containing protein [Phycisphaerae bacterium]MBE7456351.1 HDOD domain-containing protein [Planctomycetia bacterium]MCK6465681.1 HDOD domain-containing protein [Phycisphaerae bacterium]MCL4718469.1 HDOD domain-containing protein [Phycisphaerae bacterium]